MDDPLISDPAVELERLLEEAKTTMRTLADAMYGCLAALGKDWQANYTLYRTTWDAGRAAHDEARRFLGDYPR